jgi:hypothetical protein
MEGSLMVVTEEVGRCTCIVGGGFVAQTRIELAAEVRVEPDVVVGEGERH